MSQNPHQVP